MKRPINFALATVAVGVIAVHLSLIDISWDEGWNFCVARNLVENNHFGCSILGKLTNARLANGWFPILSAALGFKIFGVGIVAGRVMMAVITLLAIGTLLLLTRRFAGVLAVWAAALVLMFVSADERIHPLIIGAQVWGEMPMILALSVGYILLCIALTSRFRAAIAALLIACGCFGIALQTKVQAQPFLMLSLGGTALFALVRWKARDAVVFAVTMIGVWWCWHHLYPSLPQQPMSLDPASGTVDASSTIGWVVNWRIRLVTAEFALRQGWYLLFTLCFLGYRFVALRGRFWGLNDERLTSAVISLYILVGSWLAWFILLSVDFARYLAPPLILGAPLVALAIKDITQDDLRAALSRWWRIIKGPPRPLYKAIIVLLVGLSCMHVVVTAADLGKRLVCKYKHQANPDMIAMARYINTKTPPGSLIETYETMLFFMLDRPFHYPPDQINIDKIRESYTGEAKVKYDPLEANPDYVLTGPWDDGVFKIYDELLASGKVSLVRQDGGFRLYRVNGAR